MNKFNTFREADDFRDTVLVKVAEALGAIVTRDADSRVHGFKFIDTEEELWATFDSRKNRFHFSGVYPKSKIDGKVFTPRDLWNPKEESPSIYVSADKTPARIATDVGRRLLPAYRAVLVRCQEIRDNHDKYIRSSNGLADDLAKILGVDARGAYHSSQPQPERRHVSIPMDDFCYGDIETSGDSASFNLRGVKADTARKLAQFIRDLKNEAKA